MPEPRTWQTAAELENGQWVVDANNQLWQYVYEPGGFEGFQYPRGGRVAPDPAQVPGPYTEHDDPANYVPLARLCLPLGFPASTSR